MTTKANPKSMPNNFEAEQSLLGAILINNLVGNDIFPVIKKEDFYYENHRIIYETMKDINGHGGEIDVITLSDKLSNRELFDNKGKVVGKGVLDKIGGISYLIELTELLPSAANFIYYLNIVKRDGLLRHIISTSQSIIENTYNSDESEKALAYAEKLILDISQMQETTELEHASETAFEVMQKFENILSGDKSTHGLLSGYKNLDSLTNGFKEGQMLVLAARPGCGKTSYALNIVANIIIEDPDAVIAIFNLEMTKSELVQRLIVILAKVPFQNVMAGASKEEFDRLWYAANKLSAANLYIDDSTNISAERIMSKCRKLRQMKGRLDFIVIDYLQLMESDIRRSSKQQEVSDISRSIKIMAKDLKVPVMLLSQMSRSIEQRDDKTPKLSDLRESGAIEQDADMVMFLTKDSNKEESQEEVIELIIAKHRAGELKTLSYKWEGNMVKFTQITNIEALQLKGKSNEDGAEDRKKGQVSHINKEEIDIIVKEAMANKNNYNKNTLDANNNENKNYKSLDAVYSSESDVSEDIINTYYNEVITEKKKNNNSDKINSKNKENEYLNSYNSENKQETHGESKYSPENAMNILGEFENMQNSLVIESVDGDLNF